MGNQYQLTEGQREIFEAILDDSITRIAIRAVTQYGKSEVTALAIILLAYISSKRILIVSPREEQSRIIMGYVIDHIFDNSLLLNQIEVEGSLDRFKRERSKSQIDWKPPPGSDNKQGGKGARIKILTANAREVSAQAKSLMGYGGDVIICLPYNEKILTERGYIEIGDIVENRLDVRIASYEHETKVVEYKEIEDYEKHDGETLIEIDIGDRTIRCTETHPVFVEGKGYIAAKDIQPGDSVWVLG
jgi:hypothetical protein